MAVLQSFIMSILAGTTQGANFERDRHARNRLAALLMIAAVLGATIATWGQSIRDVISTLF